MHQEPTSLTNENNAREWGFAHAQNMALMLNLETGHVSPQFHVEI